MSITKNLDEAKQMENTREIVLKAFKTYSHPTVVASVKDEPECASATVVSGGRSLFDDYAIAALNGVMSNAFIVSRFTQEYVKEAEKSGEQGSVEGMDTFLMNALSALAFNQAVVMMARRHDVEKAAAKTEDKE